MSSYLLLFSRLFVRPLAQEPVRTALTVLAVALGVGVVIAIDLAGQAAAGSFHASLESLTGKGDLLLTATAGIDERLLGTLVQLPYDLKFSPRIETFASIEGKGAALPFIGLDLIGAAQGADFVGSGPASSSPLFTEPNPVWAGPALGLRAGDRVRLLINDTIRDFRVAGVLKESKDRPAESSVIVADIGLAQKAANKAGKLDSIDVQIPAGSSVDYWRRMLQRHVPASVTIEPQGARTGENRKMLAAFRWNLRVLSYIALIVGAFLIYNTIAISVVRRRNEIGVLRAVGAAKSAILSGFLAESLFFALVGSLLGLVVGRFMATGAVRLIGNTVQSLYVSSQPSPVHMTPGAAITGIGLGVTICILAALAPAIEASRVMPVEAMARGREQYVASVRKTYRSVLAAAMFIGAAVLSQLPPVHRQPIFAYIAVVLLIAGGAALIPGLIDLFVNSFHRLIEKLLGVEALLAALSLRASLGRTSVLTAALATAVAMTASVAIMVGSFRETVGVWMNQQLKADFYLRPAGSAAADQHPTMHPAIADQIEKLPGVRSVDRFRAYPISYEGLPATLGGGESGRAGDSGGTRFLPGEDARAILSKLPAGDYAVVSEPFANKHHVRPGSMVRIPLAGAVRSFEVLGIYYDYSTERGFVVLDRRTLLKYLPDRAESNLAVYLKPGADPAAVRREIDQVISGRGILVFSNRTLRRAAIATFDRTFRITYALEAVAVVVAVMGIAGALLAMIIDRRREFALLRFLGASGSQVRRIIVCEAALLGLFANCIGLALGTFLSLILIFVINKQSFGWTIQFHWPIAVLSIVLAGVYAATVIAGLYPARVALSMNPIEVIHEE
jgi:putative ABC transport system permease protein